MVAARATQRLTQFCENQQTGFDPHSGRGTRSAGRSPLKVANKIERVFGSPAKKSLRFYGFSQIWTSSGEALQADYFTPCVSF